MLRGVLFETGVGFIGGGLATHHWFFDTHPMSGHLHHKFAVLHESLLHGKLPRSLHWTDAVELIGHLGEVHPGAGAEVTFIVGTHREIFKRPHNAERGIEEVSRLRRFLKGAASEEPAPAETSPKRMVVVIDHHGAHVFKKGGDQLAHEETLTPYDPHHFHHHLVHRKEAHYQGGRVPEENSFYEQIAKAVESAEEIVLVGHGTGKSSAVDYLVDYLKRHHPAVASRIVVTETADLSALTNADVEAIAKQHLFSAHRPSVKSV